MFVWVLRVKLDTFLVNTSCILSDSVTVGNAFRLWGCWPPVLTIMTVFFFRFLRCLNNTLVRRRKESNWWFQMTILALGNRRRIYWLILTYYFWYQLAHPWAKKTMGCFGCCEEDAIQKAADNSSMYPVKSSAGNCNKAIDSNHSEDDIFL